ncbi:McrC family protein [Novosphingobium sp. G106]|uniref:McrC family protein n=1 Tax=Novosphingobium sp. G106 TaxID=2849500 RepID=UPI001C2CD87E|nr:McrC family protein [Novosphingobium sp. G106]MBV1692070.1 McrC family protein [Novosphingobium sp. G106]
MGDSAGQRQFSRAQANALIAAANEHSLGGNDGSAVLSDHYRHLRAKQMVGVIAAPGCSLEILPKVDPDGPDEGASSVRRRLVQMLDVALGLEIGEGISAGMGQQSDSLLELLIRLFADRLLAETRRGLPRAYLPVEEDLPSLRGRIDVARQFTVNAVRPDRLACRYDALSSNIPLMQVMKTCVLYLRRHARAVETQRRLDELRFVLADIGELPLAALPWERIQIDRTSRRWETLFKLAKLFLRREWQGTHRDCAREDGITLLFPMNKLFEAYIAALLRRALRGTDIDVHEQGGLRYCLGEWSEDEETRGHTFQTRPDILLRRGDKELAVIDTKWKSLPADPLSRKKGLSQADVYQMMAYARLYQCPRLMLLYPTRPNGESGMVRSFGIDGGREMLGVAKVDVSCKAQVTKGQLMGLVHQLLKPAIELESEQT